MIKKLVLLLTICVLMFSMFGCGNKEKSLNNNIVQLEEEINVLETEIATLETERDTLANEIVDIKIENGTAKYIVTFNIKQSHFTLDIGQHLKDEMNDISIQIPVDKEYYDNVEVGDVIADDFRMGSLIFKGSFGNWDITVEDKCIQ